MKPALRALAFLLQFATIGLAIAFIVTRLLPDYPTYLPGAQPAPAGAEYAPLPASGPRNVGPVSYADAVARAAPAVVSIYANKVITERKQVLYPDPVTQKL
ncbi:MAG TPA: peptidase S1, partial [Tahibacter sp.]|nr:peptidase S1 [Tahibacter sp.]